MATQLRSDYTVAQGQTCAESVVQSKSVCGLKMVATLEVLTKVKQH
jgi:hypothetical protein